MFCHKNFFYLFFSFIMLILEVPDLKLVDIEYCCLRRYRLYAVNILRLNTPTPNPK